VNKFLKFLLLVARSENKIKSGDLFGAFVTELL